MDKNSSDGAESISTGKAFRQLVVFQVKLALDALRDFALSPLSIVAFVVDSITRPGYEESLSRRMMMLGRRSDRVINLFGEYSEGEHYTVDETLGSVEQAVYTRHREKVSGRGRERE
jgi:hypothetical protein